MNERQIDGLIGARAFRQGAWVEAVPITDPAHLRDREGEIAKARHHGLGFKAVGVVAAPE